MNTGPLTGPDGSLLGADDEAALWMAYVGLRGRFARTHGAARWQEWTGRRWVVRDKQDVHRAVRLVAEREFAALPPEERADATHLLDINWRIGPLMESLRVIVTVPRERLGLL